MTTNERNELIGRPAARREGAYTVNVTVKDVKEAFGRTDLLLVPVSGSGEKWVSMDTVTFPAVNPK